MEHELFWSKLKPSVDDTLISDTIRSSSSGENSHRTAAMELIFEKSIQGRRERILAKLKNSEAPNVSIPEAKPPAPAPAPQPPRLLSNASTDITTRPASQDSSAPTQSTRKTKKLPRREEPPEGARKNPPPSEDIVQLVCCKCNVKQPRRGLRHGLYCNRCPELMKCGDCGTVRANEVKICTNCRGKFN